MSRKPREGHLAQPRLLGQRLVADWSTDPHELAVGVTDELPVQATSNVQIGRASRADLVHAKE
jgi:hypothetical protein